MFCLWDVDNMSIKIVVSVWKGENREQAYLVKGGGEWGPIGREKIVGAGGEVGVISFILERLCDVMPCSDQRFAQLDEGRHEAKYHNFHLL